MRWKSSRLGPGGVRQDRLDDVAVRHRDPDRVRCRARRARARRCSRTASRARACISAQRLGGVCRRVGEARLAGRSCTTFQRSSVDELLDRPPRPRTVAALPQAVVDAAPHVDGQRCRDPVGRLHAPVERRADDLDDRQRRGGETLADAVGLHLTRRRRGRPRASSRRACRWCWLTSARGARRSRSARRQPRRRRPGRRHTAAGDPARRVPQRARPW